MPTNIPAISVLMPVYNALRYVAQAVQSILDQTFGDFEFIIIDDGSTDGSTEILQRFAAKDPRIILKSRPNTGYVVALNEALALAKGEFIARMDADDISKPTRFARQIEYLRATPDVVVLGTAVELIDDMGRLLLRPPVKTENSDLQAELLEGVSGIGHPTAMVRREPMVHAGGYDQEMSPSEDLDLWLRLSEVGKLANLPTVLVRYRLHLKSVSATQHQLQINKAARACEAAYKRRGIERSIDTRPGWRPGPNDSRSANHDSTVQYGWWAFSSAQRWTAFHYARQAIILQPLRKSGWKLLACSLIKPMPRVEPKSEQEV